MRPFFALVLGACNWVHGLEPTTFEVPDGAIDANPFIDEDLDGIPNDIDNCPGLPNTDQTNVADDDAPGDACDPEIGVTNTVLATYFFNTPADHARFEVTAPFSSADGFIAIARSTSAGFLDHAATLDAPGSYFAVEAGFELLASDVSTLVGVYSDAATNYGWLELTPTAHLFLSNRFPVDVSTCEDAKTCNETLVAQVPNRVVVQLRREPDDAMRPLTVRLAGTGVKEEYTASTTQQDSFGIFARAVEARLHHVIIYVAP